MLIEKTIDDFSDEILLFVYGTLMKKTDMVALILKMPSFYVNAH